MQRSHGFFWSEFGLVLPEITFHQYFFNGMQLILKHDVWVVQWEIILKDVQRDGVLAMDQMCNVKCVACSDDRTENYHPNSAVLQRFLVSLGSLFWFYCSQIYCFGSVSLLSSVLFPAAASCCFQQKNVLISPRYTTWSAVNSSRHS